MEKTLQKNENCLAMAGIASVYDVDINNVSTCIPSGDGMTVTLAQGKSWSEIECDDAQASAQYEEHLAYRHHVEMTYHGNQQGVSNDLDEMTECRFLVKVVDNNGTEWLFGHTGTPLRFTFESNNDGNPEGETAYRLVFESLCPLSERRIIPAS